MGVIVVEELASGTDMLGVITETDKTLKLKYGEDIGRMVADAGVGEHVHVHNLKTKRW